MKRSLCSVVFALSLALILSACGGGGGSSQVTAPSITGTPSVAAKTSALAVGDADCPSGGILVETGVDSNKNNILDADEISKSQKVCNGTPGAAGSQGTNGLNALVKLTQEATGANCLTGGVRIDSGMDTSKNGILDTSEITSTSYSCNGASGSASAGVTWVDVTGTTQQATSNTGYMADSSSNVTITLPASPSLGDTVQVTGVGLGGWKIAQNAGQSIMTKNLPETYGAIWTSHGSAKQWTSLASSADGTKLVAGTYNGQLYTSTDSAVTWTARDSTRNWYSVASSSDGTKLVAAAYNGQLYTSTDSGVTWSPRESVRYWQSVASSSDGTKLVATAGDAQIYTSTDSGVTWTQRGLAGYWFKVASSSNGTKLVATVLFTGSGYIYTSADSGVTWTQRGTAGGWSSVASSSDGTKLVAVADPSSSTSVVGSRGQIYTSMDSGISWTPRLSGNFYTIASSSDGTKLTIIPNGYSDQLYTSTDSGTNWTAQGSARVWNAVASSSDGSKIVAGTYNGQIYTSAQQTSTGTGGSISGVQYDAIDLQYIGNNVFTVLNREGNLVMQ